MLIPRLIHQTVKDKGSLSEIYKRNITNLQALNPDWKYTLWDDADIIRFITDHYDGDTLSRYKRINPSYGAARADYFRYLLMLKLGGVYIDIKSTCNKKLESVIRDDDVYLLSHWHNRQGEHHEGYGLHPELSPKGEYQQWHIIAVPGHPFLKEVVSTVASKLEKYTPSTHGVGYFGVLRTTGPVAYTLAIQKLEQKAKFRLVDIEALGFVHSILGKNNAHITPTHYIYQRSPLVIDCECISPPYPGARMASALQEPFEKIYRADTWDNGSGPGSSPVNTIEYRAFVSRFIETNSIRTVTDLGCGDWQFSQLMDWTPVSYIGFDVVPELIDRNRQAFGAPNIRFELFGAPECLPGGDLMLAKEVLQHLPNGLVSEYLTIIRRKYRFALITNSIEPRGAANRDIAIGGYRPLRVFDPPFGAPGAIVMTYYPRTPSFIFTNAVFLMLGGG